ncbi:MAG: hypothetical protein H6581_03550 [Bacteroidia bacterium]|nr:hypothetical protein [Bacteroidia bacterium]
MKSISWILLGISVAVNLVLIIYFSTVQNRLDGYENHPKVEYIRRGICLSEKVRENGAIIADFCDFDDDLVFDEVKTYNLQGDPLQTSYDENNNYIPEKTIFYNRQGKIRAKYLDRNEDGWAEILVEYQRPGSDSVTYQDLNQDGFFDPAEIEAPK